MQAIRPSQADLAECRPGAGYHPLEIAPFFRRFPRGAVRNLAYTFIWNLLFTAVFLMINAASMNRMPSWGAFQLIFLVASTIGYSIHLLYSLGSAAGLEAAARRAGGLRQVLYFALMPAAGVMAGFWLASLVFGRAMRSWVSDPDTAVAVMLISIVVSLVLSVIFAWRERDARVAAELAQERERTERIAREAAAANLRALQAHIEPHFLYNTLANVASLIEPQPATARRMLESFIRFLRASLATTRTQSTTLGAESELIGAYLDVLLVRMGARLRYAIDVPQELRAVAMPPMLLQPVVENAIVHGLEPSVSGGEVAIRARREGGAVAIEVSDTGAGFGATTRGGTGLTNLRDRLTALYGDRATLAIGERPGGGAAVTIRIPDES